MSSYETYDRRAADYDRTRGPVGHEIITGCLAQARVPLHTMTVLDAGCGTGNYAAALLGQALRIEAVDLSAGMLAVARGKLADAVAAGRVALHEEPLEALPMGERTVDGVMVNQVASSPTATAIVLRPTGPPPCRNSVSSMRRSIAHRPRSSIPSRSSPSIATRSSITFP
jgi:SAM-dependent methyltransferase